MNNVDESLDLVYKSISEYDKPVVACSWGKDSLVVLHLVRKVTDDFQVLWNNTKLHYPDVYRVKDQLEDKWGLDIIETKAEKTFWEITEDYGWPGLESSDRSSSANSACCYHIKKKPTKKAIRKSKWDLYFDGLTAYESDRRWMNIQEYGLSHYHKDFKLQKVHPIGYWTVDDVWDYIERNDITYPDLYDNEIDNYTKRGYSKQRQGHRVDRAIRNGCWTCTLPIKTGPEKMKQLRVHYPNLWEALMNKGLAEKILEGKGFNSDGLFDGFTDHWLENRPCYFDTV